MSKTQQKKSNKLEWVLGLLLLGGVIFALTQVSSTETFTREPLVDNETPQEVEIDEDEKKLEEIRKRDEIKRQQDLLVEETFLKEEKARTEAEKEAALAELDAQIAALEQAKASTTAEYDEEIMHYENSLEGVRAEKLDFH